MANLLILQCVGFILWQVGFGQSATVSKSLGEEYTFSCESSVKGLEFHYKYNDAVKYKYGLNDKPGYVQRMNVQSFDDGASLQCVTKDGEVIKSETLALRSPAPATVADDLSPELVHEHIIRENERYELYCSGRLNAEWIQINADDVVTDGGWEAHDIRKEFTLTKDTFDCVKLVCLEKNCRYSENELRCDRKIQKVVVFKSPTCHRCKGVKGEPGQKGDTGMTGPLGYPGIMGLPGVKGDSVVGPQGPPGAQGARGETGPRGYPGVPGLMGRPGTPGTPGVCPVTCPNIYNAEPRIYAEGIEPLLGSEERPAPAVCRFKLATPDQGPAPDPYWVMEEDKFKVKCKKETNRTCLVLPDDDETLTRVEENKILITHASEGMWLSRHGFNLEHFNTISDDQLRFLREQSRSVQQTVRVYLFDAQFEDIELAMLNYNDIVVKQAPSQATPMVYTINSGGSSVGQERSYRYVDVQLADSARRLPVVDVFVRARRRDVYVGLQLRELCFG